MEQRKAPTRSRGDDVRQRETAEPGAASPDLVNEIDGLLDEIDSVLEEQTVLTSYRQKPGQ